MRFALLLAAVLAPSGSSLAESAPNPGWIAPLEVRDARLHLLDEVRSGPPQAHPEPAYHFLDEVLATLAVPAARWPGRVRPFVVGQTLESRPIWGFVLRDPARAVSTRMGVFANLHAMEWVGTEAALAFALDFAAHPTPGVEVVVVPIVNVDARRRVEEDLRAGRRVYRRGNRARVDLNRDFAVHHDATSFWRHLFPGFHASSPAPLSQPETRALDRLARKAGFDLAVSLHAFGALVCTPWSGVWARPPDWRRLHALGTALSSGQGARAYRVVQLSRWGFFFRAQGSEIDHLYGRYGTAAFLVECTRTGIEPLHPSTWTDPFRRYNPRNPSHDVREVARLLRAGVVALATGGPVRVAPPAPGPPEARRERPKGPIVEDDPIGRSRE
ncbi:MAG: hypothetical protein JXB39_01890 [Deltaproteobacteria bacterium]|nr:hypothetical protein [Deltaproteobacteria bacterium]